MASDEKVLAEGPHWEIVKAEAQPLRVFFYCTHCGHRTSRHLHLASSRWFHFYKASASPRCDRHSICFCGCDRPEGPLLRAQAKAYAKAEFWQQKLLIERLNENRRLNERKK